MFPPVSKEILMMISLGFALLAIFYLYKDVQKIKTDVQKIHDVPIKKEKVVLPPPPPPPPAAVVQKPVVVADESE